MLELQKHVLNQVYTNPELFRKELIKSKKWLSNQELSTLKRWLSQKKFHQQQFVIHAVLTENFQLAS